MFYGFLETFFSITVFLFPVILLGLIINMIDFVYFIDFPGFHLKSFAELAIAFD